MCHPKMKMVEVAALQTSIEGSNMRKVIGTAVVAAAGSNTASLALSVRKVIATSSVDNEDK